MAPVRIRMVRSVLKTGSIFLRSDYPGLARGFDANCRVDDCDNFAAVGNVFHRFELQVIVQPPDGPKEREQAISTNPSSLHW
jgi:hypothetical protein